ncbi:MAG TPA: helix-turn-helix domain-containing protein [Acidimicrobiales bacterium]|jgi:DNA-binding response OmpR family regulator
MEVVLVRWPAERTRRELLVRDEIPRLLLVEDGLPPAPDDCLEDWVRVPAADSDMAARIDGLKMRLGLHGREAADLDENGVLRFSGRWVALPPVEARLMSALLDRQGAVVSREALARSGWPDGAPGRNALDVHVLRLRRRIDGIGLAIRTVRSRGYLLETEVHRQQASGA